MLPLNINRPLKAVTDRIQSCRTVVEALDTYGDQLVAVLSESLDPLLEDGQVTPFATQLSLFRKKLPLDRDQLVTTDRSYRDQRARESVVRRRRDDQMAEVNGDVVGLRRAFTGFYSEERLAELGSARRTPQTPVELLEQAAYLVERLGDPELDLSGSRFGDFQLVATAMTKKVSESVEVLAPLIEDVVRAERRSEAKKLAKDEALEAYNTSFVWIARTVESLCQLAGLDEVARRVRPSRRRPGETAKEPEETEGDAPTEEETQETSSEAAEPQPNPAS